MSVIITGATGYLGQHILGELLSLNYKVIAIVRSKDSQDKLDKLFNGNGNGNDDDNSNLLSFEIIPELDKPHTLDSILSKHPEVTTFINTALVVKFTADDYAKEIIDPSINIIKYTLTSIKDNAPNIKRVILTSSLASMIGPDKAFGYSGEYSDDDWSPLNYELGKINGTMAYFTAKKLAEQEAWNFIKQQKPNFDFVAIMPSLIIGPVKFESEITKDYQPSTSGMIGGLLKLKPNDKIPELVAGAVDVRDVAKIHAIAIKDSKFSNQRILLESNKITNDNIIQIIIDNFPSWKSKLPKPNPINESNFVKPNDKKSKKLIGFELRNLDDSVIDLIKQIENVELVDLVDTLKV